MNPITLVSHGHGTQRPRCRRGISAPLTDLLQEARAGSPEALEELYGHAYQALLQLARRQLRGKRDRNPGDSGHLVGVSWERLSRGGMPTLENREHFFHASERVMRHYLIDEARAREAAKRGSGEPALPLDEERTPARPTLKVECLLALHGAVEELRRRFPTDGQVFLLRCVLAMTEDEVARELQIGPSSVRRHLSFAKAWVHRRLTK